MLGSLSFFPRLRGVVSFLFKFYSLFYSFESAHTHILITSNRVFKLTFFSFNISKIVSKMRYVCLFSFLLLLFYSCPCQLCFCCSVLLVFFFFKSVCIASITCHYRNYCCLLLFLLFFIIICLFVCMYFLRFVRFDFFFFFGI